MNRNYLLAAFTLLAVVFVTPALGQPPANQPRPQPAAPQTATQPGSKVVVIYTADFQEPKTGIAKFNALLTQLNNQFQKQQDELNQIAQRLNQLQAEITNMQSGRVPGVTPAQVQAKIDSLDQQKRDYQRRGEDAQGAYQKRRVELFAPLQDDISKALDAYAKARGIAMIIDGSQVPLIYAADSIDITRAFIADYNSKNPATASVTTPR